MLQQTTRSTSLSKDSQDRILRRIAWVIALGVLLNPLNSSMIAVALLKIGTDFQIGLSTVTWMVSGFYLAGAVGPSLAGKLADLFGAKRLFIFGLFLVLFSSLLAPLAPNFSVLLALRIIQALGSSVAFPAGMSILRSVSAQYNVQEGDGKIASSLGLISIMANVMAAFGPTLGGILVGYVSWHAIFLINIPIVIVVLLITRSWLPSEPSRQTERAVVGVPFWRRMDILGIFLFIIMLISLMLFLLSLSSGKSWWLLIVSAASAISFILWERRTTQPFLNIQMLASNRRLLSVYLQFTTVNIVFYSLFFCLPLWLDQVKGFDPKTTGLLMLPFAGLGVIMTPIAVKVTQRYNYRTTIMIGNISLVLSTLLLLTFNEHSSIFTILLVTAAIGIPEGFNNMGLQTALYQVTPPEEIGVASGLFQTFRSIGSILSTSLLGIIFGSAINSNGLHTIALITAGLAAALLLVSFSQKST